MSDNKEAVATITAQMPTVGVNAAGVASRGYRVNFQTAKGVQGNVFVTEGEFTPDHVNALVREQAVKLDALQGSPVY